MAKVKTILPLVGTISGINFYYRKGELIARKAGGGFNGKAIKKSPTMVRVREQNNEFANCSKVNKAFKYSILDLFMGHKDGTLHSRLMALFLKLKTLDSFNKRGERTVSNGVQTPMGKKFLKDFSFTPKKSTLLPAHYFFDWSSLSFHVNGFDVRLVKFPKNADVLEVRLRLLRFDFENLTYKVSDSNPLIISRDFDQDHFSLTAPEPDAGSGLLIAFARVSFYQLVGGQKYLLPGDGALRLRIVGIED